MTRAIRFRLPADSRTNKVTGMIVRPDAKKRRLFLMTTDRKAIIARLYVTSRYTTPRHTPGAQMVCYWTIIRGRMFIGRSAGLILTLRAKDD